MVNSEIDLVCRFIQRIWNENKLAELSDFLDDQFIDHSIPLSSFQNRQGLLLYLTEMANKVSHYTEILETTVVDHFVFCKIRIYAGSVLGPSDVTGGIEILDGYRLFKMHQEKIIEHWDIW